MERSHEDNDLSEEFENEFEFFPTEREVVYSLLESDLLELPGGTWIEPCAGTGRIISAVNERRDDVSWVINEIDGRFGPYLAKVQRSRDLILPYGDFVTRAWPFFESDKADVLIMNPPFTMTKAFVLAAMDRARYVVCLQRQGWFGTKIRAPWLRAHCPDTFDLPWRPSFRPDGKTDNCEYSWYVWHDGGHDRREGRRAMLDNPRATQPDLFGALLLPQT
jgi:hypothetical protein